jgi:hypothetical protein
MMQDYLKRKFVREKILTVYSNIKELKTVYRGGTEVSRIIVL